MNEPVLIDIGANLTHSSFDGDRAAVIEAAQSAGVAVQIATGTDVASSIGAAHLAAGMPGVLFSTAGVHPHQAREFGDATLPALAELLQQAHVVAVGECGLDYFRDFSPRAQQVDAFVAQLELASRCGKPVFLHQRDAHADFVAILREHIASIPHGVAHCFTGGRRELDDYLSLGLFIGVTGWICDERRGMTLLEAAPHIPAARLMLETDAPYLLPRNLAPPAKTRRNEPRFLVHVARALAQARGDTLAEIARTTTANAIAFFNIASHIGESVRAGLELRT